jgi:hypothetical protein
MDKTTRKTNLKEKHRYWKTHIENWQLSGMSQRGYCREHGLQFGRFGYWRKKLLSHNSPEVSLVEVNLGDKPISNLTPPLRPVRLIAKTGHRIELEKDFDPIALKQLIHTLEAL